MDNSFPLDSPSTSSKTDKRVSNLNGAGNSFNAKGDERYKAKSDKSDATVTDGASALKPAIDRVINNGGALVKETATATREATAHAKRVAGRAIETAETYISQKPKRSVAIAAVIGAATAAVVLSRR